MLPTWKESELYLTTYTYTNNNRLSVAVLDYFTVYECFFSLYTTLIILLAPMRWVSSWNRNKRKRTWELIFFIQRFFFQTTLSSNFPSLLSQITFWDSKGDFSAARWRHRLAITSAKTTWQNTGADLGMLSWDGMGMGCFSGLEEKNRSAELLCSDLARRKKENQSCGPTVLLWLFLWSLWRLKQQVVRWY